MSKRLFSLIISLLLLLSMLSGCDLVVSPDSQEVRLDFSSEGLGVRIGEFYIDLNEFLPQDQQIFTGGTETVSSYTGKAYTPVNDNIPFFTEEEITDRSFEFYEDLDSLGRCGPATASIGRDLMPTQKRESIREVHPSGWQSVQYDWVDGKSLYNRCHLIGFQLAGENANEKNLITGTRSLNIHGMLPFENMVADYVKETGNHVMYRVTPVFSGRNLVADGVLMEGLSVEDQGDGITFCVFAYNQEPGVTIDYATGDNWASEDDLREEVSENQEQAYVLNTSSKKFHRLTCPGVEQIRKSNKEVYRGSRQELIEKGYKPCGSCNP